MGTVLIAKNFVQDGRSGIAVSATVNRKEFGCDVYSDGEVIDWQDGNGLIANDIATEDDARKEAAALETKEEDIDSRLIWSKGGLALFCAGSPNDNQGEWKIWIELANGKKIMTDDNIVDALVKAGVDLDAARNAVEEGIFSGLQ